MSFTPPNFETATYVDAHSLPEAQPEPVSPAGPATLAARSSSAWVARSAGALLYGGFIQLTHINVGYLSIVIAYLVAKAMMFGSNERGGREFQVSAVLLTCFAVAVGNALMLYWSISKGKPIQLTAHNLLALLRFGALEPVYEFHDSAAGALLTLFILFIGLRAAWRMTSGLPGAVRHPFSRGF